MVDPSSPATTQSGSDQGQVQIAETAIRQKSQELGLLGKLFGGREHAPINIAGSIVGLGIVALLCVPFVPESQSFTHGDMSKVLGGLILAAFTFLGGYLGGGKSSD